MRKFASILIFSIFMLTSASAPSAFADIMAYYPFNSNSNDESGYGHDGTVFEAMPAEDMDGNPNSAYFFDGINDWISVTGFNTDFMETAFSVNVWFKADETRELQTILWFRDNRP